MSHNTRDGAAWPAASRLSQAPGTDPAEFGQGVLAALFTAGLALNCALTMIPDGPAADLVRRAVDELDTAAREVPHLVRAIPGPDAGAYRMTAGASRMAPSTQAGGTGTPPGRPPPAARSRTG